MLYCLRTDYFAVLPAGNLHQDLKQNIFISKASEGEIFNFNALSQISIGGEIETDLASAFPCFSDSKTLVRKITDQTHSTNVWVD